MVSKLTNGVVYAFTFQKTNITSTRRFMTWNPLCKRWHGFLFQILLMNGAKNLSLIFGRHKKSFHHFKAEKGDSHYQAPLPLRWVYNRLFAYYRQSSPLLVCGARGESAQRQFYLKVVIKRLAVWQSLCKMTHRVVVVAVVVLWVCSWNSKESFGKNHPLASFFLSALPFFGGRQGKQ